MAWAVTVSLDLDKTDVGSVSAVFTDDDASTFGGRTAQGGDGTEAIVT